MITSTQEDAIFNALAVGMSLEDAYVYAGLTPEEIVTVSNDASLQLKWQKQIKEFEFGLLNRMTEISEKQARLGREQATTWMLEHMFNRYSTKQTSEKIDLTINMDNDDPLKQDNVTVVQPIRRKAQENV